MVVLLIKQILVLFLIIFLGFFIVKLKWLKTEDSKVLSILVVKLIMPCIIIKSFQIDYSPEIRDGFLLAILAAVIIQTLMLIICMVLKKVLSLSAVETASVFYSNSANMIVPLVAAVLGEEWVIYSSAFICVQQCFLWTHGQSLMEGKAGFHFKKIICNPNIIAVLVGVILFFSKIKLPEVVATAVGNLGNTVGPLSMLVVGALLASADWKKVLLNVRLWIVALLKMILLPFLVLLFLKYSGLSGLVENGTSILLVSLFAVIAPSASTITQLAQIYDQEPEYAGMINMLTTLLSIATMPLMVMLYLQ